jgi:hypothetical protein
MQIAIGTWSMNLNRLGYSTQEKALRLTTRNGTCKESTAAGVAGVDAVMNEDVGAVGVEDDMQYSPAPSVAERRYLCWMSRVEKDKVMTSYSQSQKNSRNTVGGTSLSGSVVACCCRLQRSG